MSIKKSQTEWTKVMAAEDTPSGVKPLLLRVTEAAEALNMSPDSFERHVEPEIKLVRVGRLKLVPRVELERFIEENAHRVSREF